MHREMSVLTTLGHGHLCPALATHSGARDQSTGWPVIFLVEASE